LPLPFALRPFLSPRPLPLLLPVYGAYSTDAPS
jgi:hypothetical protein